MFGAINLSVEKTGKPDTEWNVTAISTGSNASNLTGIELLAAPNTTLTQQVSSKQAVLLVNYYECIVCVRAEH